MIPASQLRRLFSTDIDESCTAAWEIGLHHSREEWVALLDIVPRSNTCEQRALFDVVLHAQPWHPQRKAFGPVAVVPDFDDLQSDKPHYKSWRLSRLWPRSVCRFEHT